MHKYSSRQIEIMEIATDLISEKGIQHLTIKNLAAALGVTEGAIYRHFNKKQEILIGMIKRFHSDQKVVFQSIVSSDLSPIEKIENIYIERFKRFSERPALAAVIFSEEIFQNDKTLADLVASIMKSNQLVIRRIIETGQQSKSIRDDIPADQLAMVIMGLLRLIITRWRINGYKFDLVKEGDKLLDTTLKLIK